MGASLRALRALLVLAGFYLLGFVVLGALVAADFAVAEWVPGPVKLKLFLLSFLLAIPVVKGMFMLRAPAHDGPEGLRVREEQQPELWRTVRDVAELTGIRGPDEIVLTADVNAAVSEDARLLGLRAGRRRMCIGVPLMTGLTTPQLKAVLAHEFGHYGNTDTRLSAITMRSRENVLRTVRAFEERAAKTAGKERARQEKVAAKAARKGRKPREIDVGGAGLSYRLMAKPFIAYAKFGLRMSRGVGRRQELAADRTAARIAGRDVTASALREIVALDTANDFYLSRYAMLGVPAGLLPPRGEVFGGLQRLLAEPGRQQELEAVRRDLPAEDMSPYDSHPPIADRVRLIEALPDDGRSRSDQGSGPASRALDLLRDPEQVQRDLEDVVLTVEAKALERAGWAEVVHRGMLAQADADAEPLRRAMTQAGYEASLPALLDAIDAGRLWEIADRLPKSEQARRATGRAAREFVRPGLGLALSRLVVLVLAGAGHAHGEFSWSDAASLRIPDELAERLGPAVELAIADSPEAGPLRELLASADVASPPAPGVGAAEPAGT